MIWHRLRGHRIRDEVRHVNTSRAGIESGRVDHVRVCSCGDSWIHVLVNPLRGDWRWL